MMSIVSMADANGQILTLSSLTEATQQSTIISCQQQWSSLFTSEISFLSFNMSFCKWWWIMLLVEHKWQLLLEQQEQRVPLIMMALRFCLNLKCYSIDMKNIATIVLLYWTGWETDWLNVWGIATTKKKMIFNHLVVFM